MQTVKLVCAVVVVLLFLPMSVAAQDVIRKVTDEEIESTVVEIGDTEIRYRLWSQPDGPLRVIKVSDVAFIRYSSGETETFNAGQEPSYDPDVKRYMVGDIYEEGDLLGIVIRTTDDGLHGLIMHPHSPHSRTQSNKKAWCVKTLRDTFVGAVDTEDGMRNMESVEQFIESRGLSWDDFPAFNRCRELGDGWYLPAIKEAEQIFHVFSNDREFINDQIMRCGGGIKDKIDNPIKELRSSTEASPSEFYQYGEDTHIDGVFFLFGVTSISTSVNIHEMKARKRDSRIGYEEVRPVHKF